MAALECVARIVSGDTETLGTLLKRHLGLIPISFAQELAIASPAAASSFKPPPCRCKANHSQTLNSSHIPVLRTIAGNVVSPFFSVIVTVVSVSPKAR
jgi:hypothetical protein